MKEFIGSELVGFSSKPGKFRAGWTEIFGPNAVLPMIFDYLIDSSMNRVYGDILKELYLTCCNKVPSRVSDIGNVKFTKSGEYVSSVAMCIGELRVRIVDSPIYASSHMSSV